MDLDEIFAHRSLQNVDMMIIIYKLMMFIKLLRYHSKFITAEPSFALLIEQKYV